MNIKNRELQGTRDQCTLKLPWKKTALLILNLRQKKQVLAVMRLTTSSCSHAGTVVVAARLERNKE